MESEEYKKLSLKEFDRAADKFDDDAPSVYNLCRKDYPDVFAEAVNSERKDVPLYIIKKSRDMLKHRKAQIVSFKTPELSVCFLKLMLYFFGELDLFVSSISQY